jgi:hypothetical protein
MYPEVQNIRRSKHALKQLQGILPVLKPHVLLIENHMTRHYQQHRFEPHEPPINEAYSMEEVMTILKAAGHTLDQQTGLSFHGPPTIAHLTMEPPESSLTGPSDALADFTDYCLDTMDPTSSKPMVSFIKRFQNRSRETGPAEPCKHAASSRTHPANECCICRGPHFVHRCWHVLGLPEGIAAIKRITSSNSMLRTTDPGKETEPIIAIQDKMLRLSDIRTDQECQLSSSKIKAHQMVSRHIRPGSITPSQRSRQEIPDKAYLSLHLNRRQQEQPHLRETPMVHNQIHKKQLITYKKILSKDIDPAC